MSDSDQNNVFYLDWNILLCCVVQLKYIVNYNQIYQVLLKLINHRYNFSNFVPNEVT